MFRLIPPVIVGWLWLAWTVSWIAAAGWSARPVLRQSRADRWRHSLLVLAGSILLFSHARGIDDWLHRPRLDGAPFLGWGAVTLAFVGFCWTWWARVHLGRLWSGSVTLKPSHTIVRSGPYRLTRHPIYTGLLAALVATALVDRSVAGLLGAGLVIVGLLIKIQQEERLLTTTFGTAYDDYRRDVPMLVPGLRSRD